MEQFLNSQKQADFVTQIDNMVFSTTEQTLNQNFMSQQQFMKYQLDKIGNKMEDEQMEEYIECELDNRLDQVLNDLDNNLVRIEEVQQVKAKRELLEIEKQENERDLKRKRNELADKLKYVECSLGLIQNEHRIDKQCQQYHDNRNHKNRKQYYEELKKQQEDAQQFIGKYHKQTKEVLQNINEKYEQDLQKQQEMELQKRQQQMQELEEKKKQRHMKSEQSVNYIKQRQQMREQQAINQNRVYKQIKSEYDEVVNMKQEQYIEELKKMNEIKVYQQKIEKIKNNYKNHIQDDYLKFDVEYQQQLRQKEQQRMNKMHNEQKQWQSPQVF